MKARLLKKILETERTVHWSDGKVCIASSLCHDIISYNPETKVLRYALDAFGKGRESIRSEELELIWDKMEKVISDGTINEIINGNDEIENPIPVFEAHYGEVFEELTDKIGWPNVTHTGKIMYNNTHFATREEAVRVSIKEAECAINNRLEMVEEYKSKLEKALKQIDDYRKKINSLTTVWA